MAVKLALTNSGRKDIIDIYKQEMTHGLLAKAESSFTALNTLYDEAAIIAGSSDGFGRIKQLTLSSSTTTYSTNNDVNQIEENRLFSQFVKVGLNGGRVALFKKEGERYRLNGFINFSPPINPSVDTPVLINVTISIVDNL